GLRELLFSRPLSLALRAYARARRILNSRKEVPMKIGGWLSIAAMTCLVISAAVLPSVHSTMVTPHSVIPIAAGDAVFVPTVTEVRLISKTTPPPTESDCFAVSIRCFTPQSMTAGYNFGPLYASGSTGKGKTIAIIDSFGS